MKLEIIILREISQFQTDKITIYFTCFVVAYTQNINITYMNEIDTLTFNVPYSLVYTLEEQRVILSIC